MIGPPSYCISGVRIGIQSKGYALNWALLATKSLEFFDPQPMGNGWKQKTPMSKGLADSRKNDSGLSPTRGTKDACTNNFWKCDQIVHNCTPWQKYAMHNGLSMCHEALQFSMPILASLGILAVSLLTSNEYKLKWRCSIQPFGQVRASTVATLLCSLCLVADCCGRQPSTAIHCMPGPSGHKMWICHTLHFTWVCLQDYFFVFPLDKP